MKSAAIFFMILFVPLYYKFYSSLVELFLLRTASIVEHNMNTLPHKEMPSMEMSTGALLIFNKSSAEGGWREGAIAAGDT